MLVRTVECLDGQVEIELVCEPVVRLRAGPGDVEPRGRRTTGSPTRRGGDADRSGCRPDRSLGIEGDRVPGPSRSEAGDARLLRAVVGRRAATAERRRRRRAADRGDRRGSGAAWLGRARVPDHRWRRTDPALRAGDQGPDRTCPRGRPWRRSTTSLPETPGRGAQLGLPVHLDARLDVHPAGAALPQPRLGGGGVHAVRGRPRSRTTDGGLQIMYGIDGRRDLTESTRDDLSGYAGAHPVRIGNGAFDQRQNDVFGAALDSILAAHAAQPAVAAAVCGRSCRPRRRAPPRSGASPTRASWEARGKPQHYVSSS